MGKSIATIALILSALFFIPLLSLAGLILGIIALVKSKKDKEINKGFAIAAIVIGALFTIFQLIAIMVIFSIVFRSLDNKNDSNLDNPLESIQDEATSCKNLGGICVEFGSAKDNYAPMAGICPEINQGCYKEKQSCEELGGECLSLEELSSFDREGINKVPIFDAYCKSQKVCYK